jgi:hypothetical protein
VLAVSSDTFTTPAPPALISKLKISPELLFALVKILAEHGPKAFKFIVKILRKNEVLDADWDELVDIIDTPLHG